MAKFSYPSKLSKKEQEEILFRFCQTISNIKNPIEAMNFVKDLLSPQEAEMLAKRIKIAELLLLGCDYGEIQKLLKTSPSTVARVSEWLKYSGDGYRMLIERLPKETDSKKENLPSDYFSWSGFKKRYPMTFWPQLLLEEFIGGASVRQKKRMRDAIKEMDKKNEIYKRIDKALRESGKN